MTSHTDALGSVGELRRQLAAALEENVRLVNETEEALERQTAISEILRVISSSPTDVQPVLDVIAESARRFCGAEDVVVCLVENEMVSVRAHVGPMPRSPQGLFALDRTTVTTRSIVDGTTVQVADLQAEEAEYPVGSAQAKLAGYRTTMATPLLREGKAIGAILLRKAEVQPFTDKQVDLLRTFADQAVIAIENVRLFNETTEALERQTAIAGILRAISESPTDVQPVLDAIAESAARFCAAEDATVILIDGETLRTKAHHGPITLRTQLSMEFPLSRGTVTGRSIIEGRTVQVPDLQAESDEEYPIGKEQARRMGHRTTLATPLMREGAGIGAILLRRLEVRPFTEHQLELVRSFADQAVIALENVRLFNETKDALERQTAIAEILRVISSSPTEVQPVLDAVAASARRFCQAEDAAVVLRRDGEMLQVVAHNGPLRGGGTLHDSNVTDWPMDRTSVTGRSMVEGRLVHVHDLLAETDEEYLTGKAQAREYGHRTTLAAPLLREGRALGALLLRRNIVQPFTDRQQDLVRTFADQAAIAIENVRLFNETKEALDQQAATARVLQVISRSAFDLRNALETLVEEAARLCGADHGSIHRWDGSAYRTAAFWGPSLSEEYKREGFESPRYPGRDTLVGRTALEREVVHIADATTDPEYKVQSLQKLGGYRTMLGVPLIRDGFPIGVFALMRGEVHPFTDRQIELVRTFADQAAIAIENVRLFNETKEALERQTAIGEILRVISSSPTDVQPVLDAIAESAMRFCAAEHAIVNLTDGVTIRPVAGDRSVMEPFPLDRTTVTGRSMVDVRTYSIGDLADPSHATEFPLGHAQALKSAERAVAATPMVRDGRSIGSLVLWRMEPREFTEKQIQLVETFASQAVIAIENVRLFNETKEALGQQTAVRQILEATTRSAFDVVPVMQTIAERAAVLCEAEHAWVGRYTASRDILLDAYSGPSEDVRARIGSVRTLPGRALGPPSAAPAPIDEVAHREQWAATSASHFSDEDAHKRVGSIRGAYHYATWNVEDALADPELSQSEIRALTGMRAWLHVPLVKEGLYVGAINLGRSKPGRFSDAQVRLIETFADQAVIAIENVRLFHEIQDKSRQLEVASRHKSEFLANMSHELRTPLNAIIGFTDVMLEEMFGPLNEKQKEYLADVKSSGTHLLTLINDILDLSKVEAGRVELETSEFSFPEALENALTLVRERATRHGITLASEVAKDVGAITADERKIKQILVNLLANAVKFTPDGGRVSVSAKRANGEIEVAVRDTGIGVAAEDQGRIFDEFQQVGRDPERSREGTGLGLTLAKRFVELHGGRIWVESKVGKGSTFTFAIPLRQTALADAKG